MSLEIFALGALAVVGFVLLALLLAYLVTTSLHVLFPLS